MSCTAYHLVLDLLGKTGKVDDRRVWRPRPQPGSFELGSALDYGPSQLDAVPFRVPEGNTAANVVGVASHALTAEDTRKARHVGDYPPGFLDPEAVLAIVKAADVRQHLRQGSHEGLPPTIVEPRPLEADAKTICPERLGQPLDHFSEQPHRIARCLAL